MSTQALRDLNNLVVGEIRNRMAQETQQKLRSFRCGQKVSFVHKGRRYVGIIDQLNWKTASLTELNADGSRGFRKWRVAPSFLSPVT